MKRSAAHAYLVATLAVWTFGPASARAQDEEVIMDPELQGGGGASEGWGADERIVDPEANGVEDDFGWGEAAHIGKAAESEPTSSSSDSDYEYDPQANTGLARLELDGRFGSDLYHEGKLEDAYETRLRFDADVEFRRSRRLRLGLGVRTDVFWAVPAGSDENLTYRYADATMLNDMGEPRRVREDYGPLDQDRFEVDVIPLAAYVDVTAFDGFHLRAGIQSVSMSRADFYSPIDMLAVYDQRGQPRFDPGAPKIAQPALRIDWDLSSWATLQVLYLPWFMPHYSRPNRDGTVADQVGVAGGTINPTLDRLIPPSFQTQANQSAARFVGPAPDFTTPQVQARLNFRGSSYEIAVSGGTALEKLPMVYMTPAFESYLRGDREPLINLFSSYPLNDDDDARFNAAVAQTQLFDVAYPRYYQVGLDGSVDVAPVTLAFELTFSPARYLYAATLDGSRLAQPSSSEPIVDPVWDDENGLTPSNVTDKRLRKGVPMVQGVAHIDWISGETFGIAAELFWMQALERPYETDRDWWAFKAGKGLYMGALLGGTYRIKDGLVSLQTSLAALLGPSIISVSQIEVRVREGFYLNAGAMIFEGPRVKGGAQALSVGGMLSANDQAFLGFRYIP